MGWTKSPPELVDAFYQSLPENDLVEQRKMFGYPCAFVNNNMFTGLHQSNMIVRLDDAGREKMIQEQRAELFKPFPNRTMKEYIAVPEAILKEPHALKSLVAQSFDFVSAMPPKEKKEKKK